MISTGLDIAVIDRFSKYVDNDALLDRLLTQSEKEYVFKKRFPHRHIAGRFAAKEAVMKAIGTGWSEGVGWRDIEVRNGPDGRPAALLHAKAKALASGRKVFLSISYANNAVVAIAILEG